MPGKLLANLRSLSRVVGGGTPETAQAMISLYRHVVQADLDATDWVTAELVKTVENAYRDVQIAFANEVALISEAMGSDVWRVRELVNKSPTRQMHLPGSGVGGHCIPKDPWLLAHGVRDKNLPLRLIPSARAVNDGMPRHVLEILLGALEKHGIQPEGARVLVLGYAYLANSDDTRNSPSQILVEKLGGMGIDVRIQDPFVSEYTGDIYGKAAGCDALILMVSHTEYQSLDLAGLKEKLRTPILIDTRRVLEFELPEKLGFDFYSLGVGK
jgi:UDP-N-acetyl-D-mannosaminuronic acid dehydrogenase